jgi:DNA-binding XRE family transcriptional regulator
LTNKIKFCILYLLTNNIIDGVIIMNVFFKVNRMNELLFRKGWSRRAFAKKAGIGESTLIQICNGQRSPSAPVVKKIVDTLGCEMDEIMTFIGSDAT